MAVAARVTLTTDQIAAAMVGVFRVFELWGVSSKEAQAILGFPAERTFYAWKTGQVGSVPHDTIRRMSYMLGIYKSLQMVYNEAALADSWPKRANKAFAGQTPLERMCAGDVTDLAAVHAYLDAARGAWS